MASLRQDMLDLQQSLDELNSILLDVISKHPHESEVITRAGSSISNLRDIQSKLRQAAIRVAPRMRVEHKAKYPVTCDPVRFVCEYLEQTKRTYMRQAIASKSRDKRVIALREELVLIMRDKVPIQFSFPEIAHGIGKPRTSHPSMIAMYNRAKLKENNKAQEAA